MRHALQVRHLNQMSGANIFDDVVKTQSIRDAMWALG